jgi:hypothetical protein
MSLSHMQGQTAAQTIDSYLEELAYNRTSFRLVHMYRDTHDDVTIHMNNELMFAYNAWHHNRDAWMALGHLTSVQATCLERLSPVYKSKYNTCLRLLRGELSGEPTPDLDQSATHIPALLQLLKSYVSF